MRNRKAEAIASDEQWSEDHETRDWSQVEQQEYAAAARPQRAAALAIRRTLGLSIALGMAYGVFYIVFRSDVLAPTLVYVEPVKHGIAWVLEDPRRAWMALAALVIPHIGAYYLLFEDRR